MPAIPLDINLIVIRHAERVDETDQRNVFTQAVKNAKAWHGDPWISQSGFAQAAKMAEVVAKSLGSRKDTFSKVYVSPLQRTVATAELLCKALDKPLAATKSLAFAKALIDYGASHNGDISNCFEQMAFYRYDFEPKKGICYDIDKVLDKSWQKCLVRLARAEFEANISSNTSSTIHTSSSDGEIKVGRANVVVVSHRELVHELASLASNTQSFRPGYATATAFRIKISAHDSICDIQMIMPPTDEIFDSSFLDGG